MKSEDAIRHNIKAHNKIAEKYTKNHTEIFNEIEQARIAHAIEQVIEFTSSDKNTLKALDVGCGNGNLTAHLIDQGIYTVSADVSENFLRLIDRTFSGSKRCETLKLNGENLNNIPDASFDIAATYSVLHHVPDYLQLVREMCRVLKKGGVLYIDHEVNDSYYNNSGQYHEFLERAIPKKMQWKKYVQLLMTPSFYVRFIKKRITPRYRAEGDIHVWADDHIEWDKIENQLSLENCEVLLAEEYLLYDKKYQKDIYDLYKDRCSDMKILIARKK